jgi:hypothetical protein
VDVPQEQYSVAKSTNKENISFFFLKKNLIVSDRKDSRYIFISISLYNFIIFKSNLIFQFLFIKQFNRGKQAQLSAKIRQHDFRAQRAAPNSFAAAAHLTEKLREPRIGPKK